jgi:hypothetical protein
MDIQGRPGGRGSQYYKEGVLDLGILELGNWEIFFRLNIHFFREQLELPTAAASWK